jgi:hypothetical protein
VFDPAAIGAALGLPAAPAPSASSRSRPPTRGARLPEPARSLPRPDNRHLGYAITWYGLAASWSRSSWPSPPAHEGRPAHERRLRPPQVPLRPHGLVGEAGAVLHWDASAMMPPGGGAARGEQLATLAGLAHEMLTAPRSPTTWQRPRRAAATGTAPISR